MADDAHEGLTDALHRCFQGASWQRCQTHFRRNILDKTPGEFDVDGLSGTKLNTIGYHGWYSWELNFDNVRVPEDKLVGDEEGPQVGGRTSRRRQKADNRAAFADVGGRGVDHVVSVGDITKDGEPWNYERFDELLAPEPVEFPREVPLENYEDTHLSSDIVVSAPLERAGRGMRTTLVTQLSDHTETTREQALQDVRGAAEMHATPDALRTALSNERRVGTRTNVEWVDQRVGA